MIFNASWSQRLQCRSLVFPSLLLLLLCLALLPSVSANTEKEIFVAPHEQDELLFTGANDGQSVELEALNLGLHKLTPSPLCGTSPCHNLKIALNTSFVPFEKQWVLLDHLKPGKRYEVRLCWAATSPTNFHLKLYTPLQVLSDPGLITSLVSYSSRAPPPLRTVDEVDHAVEAPRSLLYLEIGAVAAYYTPDKYRMENPDSVGVEIILDPYFMNIIPESLFPIIGMITLVTFFAWWCSGRIYRALQDIETTEVPENDDREKKTT
ncbi:uncharacterized protein H6S33_011200 [Morchella sextelata]|uniref:uncharacterized protein n=1 Tax=Morchella sextelata TaxID=1174677 RepID=UPI001D03E169|nr:uncharacterized protein H6S33_011200 [Morchella sextelata]KAH0610773.1 hypothetical protein H6S33_011200 [Morchella sextelata]